LRFALYAIVGLSLIGLPVAYAMIGGLDSLAVPVGPRHGDRGRAVAERHDDEPAACWRFPLFILAAEFMNTGSIMDRLLHFCNAIVGRFRGGLAQVNVVQSIIFASMSGSALADAAASGKIMQSMMTQGR
jgi:hypothetical protein